MSDQNYKHQKRRRDQAKSAKRARKEERKEQRRLGILPEGSSTEEVATPPLPAGEAADGPDREP